MAGEQLFQDIQAAILALDEPLLAELSDRVQRDGVDLVAAIEQGYTAGIKLVGEAFGRGDMYVPELVRAGQMVKEEVARLERLIPADDRVRKGRFLIGTVEGDIHDIGKDLVATMLATRGIEVIDIGVNCPAGRFVDEALAHEVDIVGASCLLTLTLPELKKIMDEVARRGVRSRFKIVMGGAAVRREFVEELGADGYAEDMKQAADLAEALLREV